MPRRRRIFTKTNMNAFAKKSGTSLITAGVIILIIMIIVIAVVVSKLDMGEYTLLILSPALPLIITPFVFFYMGIGKLKDEKIAKEEQEIYRAKLYSSGISDIDIMSGREFENYLKVMFETLGYICTVTPYSGDYGADLILEKDGMKIAVQAKRYANKISVKSVQEICTALRYYNANEGWVCRCSIILSRS